MLAAIAEDPAVDDGDEEGWKARWLRFCREELRLADDPGDLDDEGRESWVGDGVRGFCKAHRFIEDVRAQAEAL